MHGTANYSLLEDEKLDLPIEKRSLQMFELEFILISQVER